MVEEGYRSKYFEIVYQICVFLTTKVHVVKAMLFPVVMYECKNRMIKKAELQRIDAFEL